MFSHYQQVQQPLLHDEQASCYKSLLFSAPVMEEPTKKKNTFKTL